MLLWGDDNYGQLGGGTEGKYGGKYSDGTRPVKIMDDVIDFSLGASQKITAYGYGA